MESIRKWLFVNVKGGNDARPTSGAPTTDTNVDILTPQMKSKQLITSYGALKKLDI